MLGGGALTSVSDESLARRIAEGARGSTDAEEAELYRRFAPRVRMFGRRHLPSQAASDDLAQEVLLLTIDRLRAGEVQRIEEIGSFILGTSRMMAHSERRTTKRREALAGRFMDPDAVAAAPSHAALDAPRVTDCLQHLPERDRLVVMLTFYADREAPHIAQEIGSTPGAVRVMRHRAIEHLRDCVQDGATHVAN